MQKEPKLFRARQIPEWEEYDGEIARFAQSLVEQGKIKSAAVAASVNDLASIGTQNKATGDAEITKPEKVQAEQSRHDAGEL